MTKTIKAALAAVVFALAGALAAATPSSAGATSVDYTVKSCRPYTASSEALLTVSSWLSDDRRFKTYHYRLKTTLGSDAQGFGVINVQRNGVNMVKGTSSTLIEGYFSTSNTGLSTWKGIVREYNWGVPTVTRSCSFSL